MIKNLIRLCLYVIWSDQSSAFAVCLDYLLIKLLHLDKPPDNVLILIIE